MNLALSDEQVFLREAARGALARVAGVAVARAAADGEGRPDLWPTARQAGWPGLLISEGRGGAGLGVFDAMLVLQECGRVLAGVALLGHLPATSLLEAAGRDGIEPLATGERRAAWLPARPPCDVEPNWTTDPERGLARAPVPTAGLEGDQAVVSGTVHWVPDAPGADVLIAVAVAGDEPVAVLLEANAAGVTVTEADRYDPTRSLGHVTLEGARGERLGVDTEQIAAAWYIAQSLIAAESIGSVEVALDASVAYAKERHTFGRAIGSYQAIKHALTEVLRRLENGRSLLYYAGWSHTGAPDEFPLAASAARSAAGRALDFASSELIAVHGGIGATWEHDAPYFYRRAQLSRRLLGGTADATDRVASRALATV
ncbi:MAG TPA: acyl-CoA dehydrogenase family protein [Solirubrobacteraceae bacterium]|jgi:alkylation response protein AidB-like acyl-CoA dehydrogenase|nr:acyl-CoA dehydrogenase family protein [Solirubrobacteraceae bacterium]